MENTGVNPLDSGEILDYALNSLKERGALNTLSDEFLLKETNILKAFLPDRYFPDIYLDLPLMNDNSHGMAVVLDCYDRCYLNFTSEGDFFKKRGIPALCAPENRDDLLVIRTKRPGIESFSICEKAQTPEEAIETDDELRALPVLEELTGFELECRKETLDDGFQLIITTGIQDAAWRFPKRECREALLALLRGLGCDAEVLDSLDAACFNLGVPFFHPKDGYSEWLTCLDIAAFCLTTRDTAITDCHAILRISDKGSMLVERSVKPVDVYQWHITDRCDQRCKHCYLFAEDALLKCEDTPWNQLILTLNEITFCAGSKCALPVPVISGGDPMLHPDFWRFAEELHRRGLKWVILGNPFHLSAEACERLYSLGCVQFQLSLDGDEKFHDSLRKPGSYRATLAAVKLLNDAGISTQFMATVSRQNMEEILQCMDIAVQSGVNSFTFARYCATTPEKAELYPSPEEYRDFLYRYYEKAMEYTANGCRTIFRFKDHLFTLVQYELGKFKPSEYEKKHPEMIFGGCHLGQGCSILPNGDLMACRRMDSIIGNVTQKHISDIMSSDLCKSYIDIHNITKCKDCELLQWCRGCRAVGFNATGDLQCEDPCCWKKNTGNR